MVTKASVDCNNFWLWFTLL